MHEKIVNDFQFLFSASLSLSLRFATDYHGLQVNRIVGVKFWIIFTQFLVISTFWKKVALHWPQQ